MCYSNCDITLITEKKHERKIPQWIPEFTNRKGNVISRYEKHSQLMQCIYRIKEKALNNITIRLEIHSTNFLILYTTVTTKPRGHLSRLATPLKNYTTSASRSHTRKSSRNKLPWILVLNIFIFLSNKVFAANDLSCWSGR